MVSLLFPSAVLMIVSAQEHAIFKINVWNNWVFVLKDHHGNKKSHELIFIWPCIGAQPRPIFQTMTGPPWKTAFKQAQAWMERHTWGRWEWMKVPILLKVSGGDFWKQVWWLPICHASWSSSRKSILRMAKSSSNGSSPLRTRTLHLSGAPLFFPTLDFTTPPSKLTQASCWIYEWSNVL